MTAFSNFIEDEILDHILNNLTMPTFASVWIALMTVTDGDAGGGTEVPLAFGYAREQVTAGWTIVAGVRAENTADIDFGTAAGGNWGTVVAVSVYDAATAGNLLFWGPLVGSKTVNDGDSFKFAATDLQIALD